MRIQGLQKLTLLDFPERVACTVFFAGCNFRCPFCHNASLVVNIPKEAEISEEDFKLRGHGDLFGTKQSGDMKFKIADLTKDYKILLKAKEDSEEILKEMKKENKTE